MIAVLGAINIVGVKESTGVNVLLAVVDFLTQVLLVLDRRVPRVLDPQTLVDNVHWGVAPTWKNFVLAIPIGMLAYTGIETVSNMSEEAKDESHDDPGGDRARAASPCSRSTSRCPRSRCPRCRSSSSTASTRRCSACPRSRAATPATRCSASSRRSTSASLQQPAEIYVGLLAATILFLATNAGMIGVSRLVYSMGIHRQMPDGLRRLHPRYRTPWIGIIVFSGFAILVTLPGQGRLPRQRLLVRRAAVVHDGARRR